MGDRLHQHCPRSNCPSYRLLASLLAAMQNLQGSLPVAEGGMGYSINLTTTSEGEIAEQIKVLSSTLANLLLPFGADGRVGNECAQEISLLFAVISGTLAKLSLQGTVSQEEFDDLSQKIEALVKRTLDC